MIRVAAIGVGYWGPNLVNNFHNHQSSEVKVVCDRDEGRLAQVKARFPDIQTTQNVADVLDDPDIEAVIVATPTSTHYELVKAALQAGKHVLVEKPITADLATAEELCELAEKKKRTLMVGHVFVYNSAAQRVRQYLTDGDLGRIYYISMVRSNLGPIRVDVNCAWDLASHDISLANYWLDAAPESAAAVGGAWINPGIEDTVFATLRYPNEVLVNLHVSWLSPRKNRDITVVGDQRMLTFDDMSIAEPLRIFDKQVSDETRRVEYVDSFASFRQSVRDGDILIPKVSGGEPLRNECNHFIESIQSGKPPLTGGPEGASVVRVLEAISRSIENHGREEKV
jgi:predicted dehydrogenase